MVSYLEPAHPLDAAAFHRAFERCRPLLESDPMLLPPQRKSFSVDALTRFLTPLPTTVEALFADTLQGMSEAYRYAGLRIVSAMVEPARLDSVALDALVVKSREPTFFPGHVHVHGNVENASILVVAGDLTIDGTYYGGPNYSLLAVGGAVRVGNVATQGEILVGTRLESRGVVYLHYNDYSCMIPDLRARAVVQEDRSDSFGAVTGERYLSTDRRTLRAIFGQDADVEPADEDDDDDVMLRLLGML